MSNTIALRTNMVAEAIELNYSKGSVTTILDKPSQLIRETAQAGTVQIATRAFTGYGDYDDSESNAYPTGSITQTWKSYDISNDRGVEFSVDRIENDESGDIAFKDALSLTGQFQREKGNPEIDATRFSTIAGTSGIQVVVTAATLDISTVVDAIDEAIEALDDAEVPEENRVLFVSNEVYKLIKGSDKFTFNLNANSGGDINTKFGAYDEIPIVKVPKSRFYTAIDLKDGRSTGETTGGYAKASGGKDINFLLVHQESVIPVKTLEKFKYFSPDVNQRKDAHLWQSRLYHDIFVIASKVKGIYLHHKAS